MMRKTKTKRMKRKRKSKLSAMIPITITATIIVVDEEGSKVAKRNTTTTTTTMKTTHKRRLEKGDLQRNKEIKFWFALSIIAGNASVGRHLFSEASQERNSRCYSNTSTVKVVSEKVNESHF